MKLRLSFLLILLSTWPAVAGTGQDANSSQEKAGYSVGQGAVTQVRHVTLDALPQYSAPQRRFAAEAEEREFMPVSPAQYAAMKKAALQPRAALTTAPAEPSPAPRISLEDTPGTQLNIGGGGELSCGSFIPSDHALSSSQAYLVQVLNSCIIVMSPSSGAMLSGYPKSLTSFFGAPSGDNVGDIRTAFDSLYNRFIVTAEDFTANTFYIAASATENPTGSWHVYNIGTQGSNDCGDFPMLGLHHQEPGDSKGAIYLSFDEFSCSSGGFLDDKILILPLTPIYSGSGFGFQFFFNLNFGGTTVDHVQPVYVQNRADRSRVEYLVNTRDFNFGGGVCSTGCNGLDVWAIYNGVPASGQSASLSGIHVGTANNYSLPADARQSGDSSCPVLLDTGYPAITSMVPYAGGTLHVTSVTDSSVGTPAWLYWQVQPYVNDAGAITGATILNEICQGCGGFGGDGTGGEYYPAVQSDTEGNLTFVFNYSTDTTFPDIAVTMNRSAQANGTLHDGGYTIANGQANYCQIDANDGKNRWGDYTATSPVVTYQPQFFFAGQYSDANGNWATQIGKAGYVLPSQP